MYGATKNRHKLANSRKILEYVYGQMPATKGCMENNNRSESEGGCGSWCCSQHPQVLYSEFQNAWVNITGNWDDQQLLILVERSIRTYIFPEKKEWCVFFDHDSRLCQHHETRPFACRIYGIIPDEEFKPRYERLKVIYPETRYQCNLVSTVDGSKVTKKDTDRWWNDIKNAEKSIGIPENKIHDSSCGSYRR